MDYIYKYMYTYLFLQETYSDFATTSNLFIAHSIVLIAKNRFQNRQNCTRNYFVDINKKIIGLDSFWHKKGVPGRISDTPFIETFIKDDITCS